MISIDSQLCVASIDNMITDQRTHGREHLDERESETYLVAHWLKAGRMTVIPVTAMVANMAMAPTNGDNYGGISRDQLSRLVLRRMGDPATVVLLAGLAAASRELAELILDRAVNDGRATVEQMQQAVERAFDLPEGSSGL